VETPPIIDEGRKTAALRGLGPGDFEEPFGEEDDRGYLEGFTMVDGPQEREGSLD
jgi:hypothetical protein